MDWKRWLKRVGGAVLLVLVIRTAWLVGQREWQRSGGEKELTAAAAETDEKDPDWRWDALAAKRPRPPEGKNGAELVARVKAGLPKGWGHKLDLDESGETRETPPANQRFPDDRVAAVREEVGRAGPAVEVARGLKDVPSGHRDIKLATIPTSTLLEETQATREVANVLRWDVVAAVEDGDAARAADDLRAMLNTSRSIGDEPTTISQLVRIATRAVASRSLEWTLAQTTLTEPQLAALQSAWAADAEEPILLHGLRGERAMSDLLLTRMMDGTVSMEEGVADGPGGHRAGTLERFGMWLYRGRLPRERAFLLRWFNQAIEAAGRPVHEQLPAMDALPFYERDRARGPLWVHGPATDEKDLVFSRLMIPAVAKFMTAAWRGAAEARCTAVGITCERFRLRTGRWPKELAELPADLLPGGVPLDPFDARPLRYRTLDDGVVVYSIGQDGTDDGGALVRNGPSAQAGVDVGFRLWSPEHRRRPAPLPEAPEPRAAPEPEGKP